MALRFPSAFGVSSVLILLTGCGATAHDFVHDKTGIEVSREVRLCSNGVLHDDDTCRPSGTGGGAWKRNTNFDIFAYDSLAVTPDDIGILMSRVQHRYLGTPFWLDHLQPNCKDSVQPRVLPGGVAHDYIDLAAEITKESSRTFAVEAVAKARKLNLPVDAQAEVRFRTALQSLVEQKIDVKMLWFVTTYTGGRHAIESNPALTACRTDLVAHERDGAKYVTGVAGFVILSNRADSSLTDRDTLRLALGAMLPGSDPSPMLDASLAASWEKNVNKVAKVRASTRAMVSTVYPLWVQFE